MVNFGDHPGQQYHVHLHQPDGGDHLQAGQQPEPGAKSIQDLPGCDSYTYYRFLYYRWPPQAFTSGLEQSVNI